MTETRALLIDVQQERLGYRSHLWDEWLEYGIRFFAQRDISEVSVGPSGIGGKPETVNLGMDFQWFSWCFYQFLVGSGTNSILILAFCHKYCHFVILSQVFEDQRNRGNTWVGRKAASWSWISADIDCRHLHHSFDKHSEDWFMGSCFHYFSHVFVICPFVFQLALSQPPREDIGNMVTDSTGASLTFPSRSLHCWRPSRSNILTYQNRPISNCTLMENSTPRSPWPWRKRKKSLDSSSMRPENRSGAGIT